MNPKRTDGSTRRVVHALFVPAFTLVIAAGTPCAVAQPAVVGQWLAPVDCWPDKTMHTLHVPITVMIAGSPVKVARLLQWNSSGCPTVASMISVHCSATQTVEIVIPPCSAYALLCHPGLAQPWPPRMWNPIPASGPLCPDPLDGCADAVTYPTGFFQSWEYFPPGPGGT